MNEGRSRGHGWAIASGIALGTAAIVMIATLVTGGSSFKISSTPTTSISISHTTTIVKPARTTTNPTSSTP